MKKPKLKGFGDLKSFKDKIAGLFSKKKQDFSDGEVPPTDIPEDEVYYDDAPPDELPSDFDEDTGDHSITQEFVPSRDDENSLPPSTDHLATDDEEELPPTPAPIESTLPRFSEFKIKNKARGLNARRWFDLGKAKVKNLWDQREQAIGSLSSSLKKAKVPNVKGIGQRLTQAWRERDSKSFKATVDKVWQELQKIDWDGIYRQIFKPESRKAIHRGFVIALVVSGSYMVGKVTALLLSGQAPDSKSRSAPPVIAREDLQGQYNAIVNFDPFNAAGEAVIPELEDKKPVIDGNLVCERSNKESGLPVKLVNTTVLQDSVKSIASVQVRSAPKMVDIREGENVEGMLEVGRIDRLKVIFKNLQNGQCEFVENKEEAAKLAKTPNLNIVSPSEGRKLIKNANSGTIQNTGNTFKIKKNVRDEALQNISEILTQARAIQIKNPDGSLCFKMTEIVAGSIYSKLNIQDEDIICQINGKKIDNLNEVMGLFGRIKEIDHFELSVLRSGMEQNLEYDFE
jgi:type II secretory pathway component PulC